MSDTSPVCGVVDLYRDGTHKLLWLNEELSKPKIEMEKELVDLARQRFEATYPGNTHWDARVFVLSPLVETAFHKYTPRGMRGKEYFWVKQFLPASIEQLAQRLRTADWRALKQPVR